jgi:outer membrane protein assembly factor BamE (lipoprotein component of BamABCDE complex)
MFRISLVCLACVLICGCCGVLPIPTAKHTPKRYGTRGEIERRALLFVKAGSTTREDVLLNLGEPDLAWGDETYFAYRWITVNGYVVAWMGDGHTADGESFPIGKARHDLVIEFDEDGRVARYGDIKKWASARGPAQPMAHAPAAVRVSYSVGAKPKHTILGTLRLSEESLDLEDEGETDPRLRIDPGTIVRFDYSSKKDAAWHLRRFRCDLEYRRADGRRSTLQIYLSLTDLPVLIDYLGQRCPQAVIKS